MASHSDFTLDDISDVVEAKPIKLPTWFLAMLVALVILGAAFFVYELLAGDAKRAWMALQVNMMYWIAISAASSCFTAVFHICNAQWARPVRRIFESGIVFFSLTPLFLVAMYFGHHYLFVWAHQHVPGKGPWLTSNFVFARDIILLCFLGFLARKVVRLSLSRDLSAVRDGRVKLTPDSSKRWNDDKLLACCHKSCSTSVQESTHLLGRFSPAIVIFYALVMSFICWDQLMSVDPLWYSTLYGAYYFMTAVYGAVAFAAMGAGICATLSPVFYNKIKRKTLHDLGKLLFGFGIFWAYLFWSHYLPIWYGNMPEETAWIILRLREEPWRHLAWMILGMNFIVPFLLGLSRDLKQVPQLLFATGAIVSLGIWLQMYLLFAPTLYPDYIAIGLTDVAVGLALLSLYVIGCSKFFAKAPLMPFGDLCK